MITDFEDDIIHDQNGAEVEGMVCTGVLPESFSQMKKEFQKFLLIMRKQKEEKKWMTAAIL